MIDKFDYLEPSCPLSGGKEFYYPQKDDPIGRIDIRRVIAKADCLFDKNDYEGAGRLLEYWKNEAKALKDKRGELAIESELVGFYRKQNNREKGLNSIQNALFLVDELGQGELASGATVFINCATAYKAFDMQNKALPLYLSAEEIYIKVLSESDPRFGGLYNNMALTLVDLGEFQKAEKSYQKALEVMKNQPNGETDSAITYVNMAHMYETFEKDEKIKDCLQTAYNLLKTENLPHNGYYAFVLEKCAPSFKYFGNLAVYEELQSEAQEIYARA